MVEEKVMEEAKIKMRENNAILTKRLIILSMIAIINMRNVHTMHMIPRIVNTSQKIKIMLKKMKRKPTMLRKMTKNVMYFILACLLKRNIMLFSMLKWI